MKYALKYTLIALVLLISIRYALADKIPAPPPLKNEPAEEQLYLQTIFNNLHSLETLKVEPFGSKVGKRGDTVLFMPGGSGVPQLRVNTNTSNKTWLGVTLTDLH